MNLKPTTMIALDWAIRCFGSEHVHNRGIRALRIAEEAIELCQAERVSLETMHRLVDEMYGRPPGEAIQEIGGVMMTATVYCAALGIEPDAIFLTELRRVMAKSPEHFAKRNAAKISMGFGA